MYIRHEGTNVKHVMSYDLMNMRSKLKTRTKVNHIIKDLTIVFLLSKFIMEHFLS